MKLTHLLECTNCFAQQPIVEHDSEELHPGETTKHVVRLANCHVCGHNQFHLITVAHKTLKVRNKVEITKEGDGDEGHNDGEDSKGQKSKGN